jgi:putative endopeptidase
MKMKVDFNHEFLGGPVSRPVREERCTRTVMRHFTMELDSILLPKIFPNFPKKKFNKSVEKIRKSLIEQLTENTWLAPESKKAAIKKMKKVHFMLVSPNNKDEWNFHPRAVYSNKTPIANELKLAILNKQKELQELKGPISPRRWGMGPLTVNAYYNPTFNHIVFPVGILQYPFYDPSEPEEANLGAVGAVIAHELGHGVDDEGSKFDEQGRLHEWMTSKDRETFIQRGSKLIDQFNKIGHNGKLTLGENIGDLVGITTAYRAAHPKTIKEKQFFFLQYARVYCGVARPSYQELLLKTDPHSLDFARVNEQMKNQKGFQEAFSCPAGSPMTLPEKDQTVIW